MSEFFVEEKQNVTPKKPGKFKKGLLKLRRFILEHRVSVAIFAIILYIITIIIVGGAHASWLKFAGKKVTLAKPVYGMLSIWTYIIDAVILGIYFFIRMSMDTTNMDKFQNFRYSDSDVAGACRWMTDDEKLTRLNYNRYEDTTDDILGYDIDDEGNMSNLVLTQKEEVLFPNHHRLICGGSGCRKTTTHLLNHALQAVRRGESIILTDPKGELYEALKTLCEKRGYSVKQFNLDEPSYSDAIDILEELKPVEYTDNYETELMTNCQILSQAIMMNTQDPSSRGSGPGTFWYDTSDNVLQSILFKHIMSEGNSTFEDIYKDLQADSVTFGSKFSSLPSDNPARSAMTGFLDLLGQGKADLCAQILNGLRTRLKIFNNKAFREIVSNHDMDLKSPGFEKCAYFIILPDQHHTMDFMASLYFSLIFNRLVAASKPEPGRRLPKRVNFLLDEFYSSGRIPDFDNKLATVRSRNIAITIVLQNIGQLVERYPGHQWEGIIGNCDENLYIGGSDVEASADYYEKRLGVATAMSEGERHSRFLADPMGDRFHPQRMVNTSLVGKSLMSAAELMQNLDRDHNIVFLKQEPPLLTGKVHYKNNPLSSEIVPFPPNMHVPVWARRAKGYPLDMPDEELRPLVNEANYRKLKGCYPTPDEQFACFADFLKAKEDGTLPPVPEDAADRFTPHEVTAREQREAPEDAGKVTSPKKRPLKDRFNGGDKSSGSNPESKSPEKTEDPAGTAAADPGTDSGNGEEGGQQSSYTGPALGYETDPFVFTDDTGDEKDGDGVAEEAVPAKEESERWQIAGDNDKPLSTLDARRAVAPKKGQNAREALRKAREKQTMNKSF